MEGQDLVEQDIEKVRGITFLQRNLSMITENYIRHDANLVASSIIELICDDLKYQDKQNDPQYLMLNTKLREEKRINKIKRDMERKAKKGKTGNKKETSKRGKSKFSNKYSERIASIREADAKARRKLEKENKKEKRSTNTTNTSKLPKSARVSNRTKTTKVNTKANKKTPQQLREEMIKKLENSKLNEK